MLLPAVLSRQPIRHQYPRQWFGRRLAAVSLSVFPQPDRPEDKPRFGTLRGLMA